MSICKSNIIIFKTKKLADDGVLGFWGHESAQVESRVFSDDATRVTTPRENKLYVDMHGKVAHARRVP